MGWFASLFGETAATAAEGAGSFSFAPVAAQGVDYAATAANISSGATTLTEYGGTATAAETGISMAQALQYAQQGATLLQGVSGYTSGKANEGYLQAASKQARMVGAANKNLSDARGRAQLGELRAQMGAQGTTITGSPMLVYLDSVRNAAIESANEYYKGEVQSTAYKQQAKVARKGGQADLWSGIIGGAGPSAISLGSRLLGNP